GMYWMKLCAIYRDGTRSPSDISSGPPALKILVDTLKPVVRITSAERQGDGVAVRWEIQEDHPDLASIKMEYRSAEDGAQQWYTMIAAPPPNGSRVFRYPSPAGLSIRLQLRDTAGNAGMDVYDLPATGSAGASPITQTSATGVGPNVLPNIPSTTQAPAP